MIPPTDDNAMTLEKLQQDKQACALFHCGLYDADVVKKIAEEFLPGLASACVDNTTGGLFRSPASVAVDIRKEMIEYLTQQSENFVAECVVLDGELSGHISDDPYEILSDFVDDFASSKRNFFSKVSGWLLSDRREDRIDDFVQEMEMTGFWLLGRRESVAQTLLKNVDFKRSYHCTMSFNSAEEMEEHKLNCSFRAMTCPNEGCNATFSAAHSVNHDSICPFKILKCEQNCDYSIMRREMDRHCITVCPMKLVKCPFHSVGCNSSIPKCRIDQHRLDDLNSHLILVLQYFHKDVSLEDLHVRLQELMELSSPTKLAAARDARTLMSAVKDLEARLGPQKVTITESKIDDAEDQTDASSHESPKEAKMETSNRPSDCSDVPNSRETTEESPDGKEKVSTQNKDEMETRESARVDKTENSIDVKKDSTMADFISKESAKEAKVEIANTLCTQETVEESSSDKEKRSMENKDEVETREPPKIEESQVTEVGDMETEKRKDPDVKHADNVMSTKTPTVHHLVTREVD